MPEGKKKLSGLPVETWFECTAECSSDGSGGHQIGCRPVEVPVALAETLRKSQADYEAGNTIAKPPDLGMAEWLDQLRELGDFIGERYAEFETWEVKRGRLPRRLAASLLEHYRIEKR